MTKEFEQLLRDAGIDTSLVLLKDNDGNQRLYFNTDPPLPFFDVASSGIKQLYDLFITYRVIEEKASLLVLDAFDAFYHVELAEHIVKMLKNLKKHRCFSLPTTQIF